MQTFREFLNEAQGVYSVLPIRTYVKGATVEKSVISAIDFFSANDKDSGAIFLKNIDKEQNVLVYTSGSGEAMFDSLMKGLDSGIAVLKHDQTGKEIGAFKMVGYLNYNASGITKMKNVSATDKIAPYTFK